MSNPEHLPQPHSNLDDAVLSCDEAVDVTLLLRDRLTELSDDDISRLTHGVGVAMKLLELTDPYNSARCDQIVDAFFFLQLEAQRRT